MEDRDLIINQIRQRLEILYQIVEDLQNGDDPGENYYTKAQINALLIGKVDVVAGKGLSTNDYTNADKAAVASIADISYNLGVLESVVDGLFDPLDETVAQGGEVSSAQKADIREQKPISLNGNVYYFVEDNGTSYIYCSYDDANSQLLIAAIGKSNWLVNFNSESLGGGVTGVKGNAESTYRTGNVNITKANIGLGNVDNTSDMDKPLSTAAKTYIDDANDVQDRALFELYGADANQQLEIDYSINTGAKNLLKNTAPYGDIVRTNITFSHSADDVYTVNAAAPNSANTDVYVAAQNTPLKAGRYVLTGCPAGGNNSTTYKLQIAGVGYDIGNGFEFTLYEDRTVDVYIRIWAGYTPQNLVFKPMIRPAEITDDTYVPYAPTNRELYETKTEQTETNVIANLGAKNLFDIQKPSTVRSTSYNVTSDGGVDLSCSNAVWTQYIIADIPVESGREYAFTLYVDAISGTDTTRVYIRNTNVSGTVLYDSNNISAIQTLTTTITPNADTIWVGIYLNNSATAKTASAKIRAMLRHAEITDGTFQPYAPTNRELYETKLTAADVFGAGTLIPDYADLDTYTTPGKYYGGNSAGNSVSGLPVANGTFNFSLEVRQVTPSQTFQYLKICRNADDPYIYIRRKAASWGSWYRFAGEAVVTSVQSVSPSLMLNREEITPLKTDEIEERGEMNGTSIDWENE